MTTGDVNVGVSNIVIMNRIQETQVMYNNISNGQPEPTSSTGPSSSSTVASTTKSTNSALSIMTSLGVHNVVFSCVVNLVMYALIKGT
jgi:hypothetical protein